MFQQKPKFAVTTVTVHYAKDVSLFYGEKGIGRDNYRERNREKVNVCVCE